MTLNLTLTLTLTLQIEETATMSKESQAEFLMYTRNFEKGCQSICTLADEYQMRDEKLSVAKSLIELCRVQEPSVDTETLCPNGEPWNPETGFIEPDAICGVFDTILGDLSYCIYKVPHGTPMAQCIFCTMLCALTRSGMLCALTSSDMLCVGAA